MVHLDNNYIIAGLLFNVFTWSGYAIELSKVGRTSGLVSRHEKSVKSPPHSITDEKGEVFKLGGTSWWVGAYENRGKKCPPGPVPWTFYSDGLVKGGNRWSGIWKREENQIRMKIVMNDNNITDEFQLKFIDNNNFIAYKNGKTYRWGVTTDNLQ